MFLNTQLLFYYRLSIKKVVPTIIHQVTFHKIIGLKHKNQYSLNGDLPD
jgi:hypothetical protein